MLTRFHDYNEPISHFNIYRGQSGVTIMFSNKLTDKITKLNVGNERIITLELDLFIQGSNLALANLINASSFPKKQLEITITCYF